MLMTSKGQCVRGPRWWREGIRETGRNAQGVETHGTSRTAIPSRTSPPSIAEEVEPVVEALAASETEDGTSASSAEPAAAAEPEARPAAE